MFKHILLPTDGSELSERAVPKGISLAKAMGARVTAFHAVQSFNTFTSNTMQLELTTEEYTRVSGVATFG